MAEITIPRRACVVPNTGTIPDTEMTRIKEAVAGRGNAPNAHTKLVGARRADPEVAGKKQARPTVLKVIGGVRVITNKPVNDAQAEEIIKHVEQSAVCTDGRVHEIVRDVRVKAAPENMAGSIKQAC